MDKGPDAGRRTLAPGGAKDQDGGAAPAGLADALRRRVDGEVRFDAGSRGAYATDGSNYRQVPIGVVVPRTVDAAATAVAVCAEHGVPVLSRGGGTSLAGQCTNAAVVIDWTKYCHGLVSVDPQARTCVVEPGIVLDELNRQLGEYGLQFGPKPSTHSHCALGGMIGNNSCGASAQAYGKTVDNVRRLEVLTYDGARFWAGPTSDEEYERIVAEGGRRAEIYRGLRDLADRNLAEIRRGYPRIPRRVSGYNLDSLLPENGFDVARALVGSEGTLVTVLHAELELVPVPEYEALLVLGYPDIASAADEVPKALEYCEPSQLEALDGRMAQLMREENAHTESLDNLPAGESWLLIQFAGDSREQVDRQAHGLLEAMGRGEDDDSVAFSDDPRREQRMLRAREAGLGVTARPPDGRDTWEGWEDSAAPPERLGDYLRDLTSLLREYGYEHATLYGHFGQGCVHTRIPFGLTSADGVRDFRDFLFRAAELVTSYGGSLSGEHGDGQSRAELLPVMFGDRLVRAFGELKALFDPDHRMNPGKVTSPYRVDENLRLGSHWRPAYDETHFGYPEDDHDFTRAVLRCVGIGNCRSHRGGVMCPSYRATGEEEHSTRGRARLLFEMLGGHADSAVNRRLAQHRGQGRPRPVPRLQGLQIRLPDRRGHGHLQGRVPRPPLQGSAAPRRALRAGLAAAVGPGLPRRAPAGQRGPARPRDRQSRQAPGGCRHTAGGARLRRAVLPPVVARPGPARTRPRRPPHRRPVAGHLQHVLPPEHRPVGRPRPGGRRFPGDGAHRSRVLRADLDLHRPTRHR